MKPKSIKQLNHVESGCGLWNVLSIKYLNHVKHTPKVQPGMESEGRYEVEGGCGRCGVEHHEGSLGGFNSSYEDVLQRLCLSIYLI